MNVIFNPYFTLCIVYIDDVLIFSNFIEQHFKYLKTLLYVVKASGFVVFEKQISLFQTRVRFLGHYIYQGTTVLIERSLEFANRFPDKILDKTQLQRFLGSLNYVLDFCPNINRIGKPLHDRLKKNLVPWTDEHTKVIQQIKKHIVKIPCLHLADPSLPSQ